MNYAHVLCSKHNYSATWRVNLMLSWNKTIEKCWIQLCLRSSGGFVALVTLHEELFTLFSTKSVSHRILTSHWLSCLVSFERNPLWMVCGERKQIKFYLLRSKRQIRNRFARAMGVWFAMIRFAENSTVECGSSNKFCVHYLVPAFNFILKCYLFIAWRCRLHVCNSFLCVWLIRLLAFGKFVHKCIGRFFT